MNNIGGKYTKIHGVKKIVYYEEHENLEEARVREIKIKDWSQKKKKRLLIDQFSLEEKAEINR